ncbi:2-polyprenyl-6-methoxyphenol hydroxylase-like FAD-dependent oxidoreductase [Hamadaea flava]|uniref:FAD-dependent oxidoreductase n=1 Tax=Hamadaea flava TaxID=1742688 RepID=A0ABV8M137_9ACTN|nr:FAD-dependent oxidoreductase [Hamadaea flava]MCP2324422.1 2-polyprenyl-6-methoxyphenol hydroxylase-like FAD-dependent oxidoreductase [Hamadaea flava]
MSELHERVDVVVAGAGPVGLMLACELGLAGVRVTVLERRTDIDQTIKAGALNHPTLQALDRRGLSPKLAEAREATLARMAEFRRMQAEAAAAKQAAQQADQPAGQPGVQQTQAGRPEQRPVKFVGHFGGLLLDGNNLDPADPDIAGEARLGTLGMVGQQQLEAILEERAIELGVDIRRGVTLTSFEDHGDRVVITTDQGVLEAGWLAGCDGGRSTVRKLAGFDFPGTDPEITAYQAMAEMTDTDGLEPGWHITPTGVYAFGPMPGRVLVAEFGGAPTDRTSPVTEAELEGAVRRVTGVPVTVTGIKTCTRFTDNARQVPVYRQGRVLLAGDAAHVHSPFGGQGLNLGVGDAMNLGWKLAATIAGWAPEGLLDTYTAERHPIGAWVLNWTRAQIAIMRPDPHARAIRAVVEDLAGTVDGTTYLAKRISGVWQHYDLAGDHPLTGRSAPELELSDGSCLPDHLHAGRTVLFDFSDDAELRAAAGEYADRLTVVTANAAGSELRALLVRPDGFVAWASEEPGAGDLPKRLADFLG